MKFLNLIFFLLLFPIVLKAQLTFEISGIAQKKITEGIPEDSFVKLINIDYIDNAYYATVLCGNREEIITTNQLKKIDFKPTTTKEFWQSQVLINSTIENLLKNGMQYKLRKELEEEAIDYIKYMVDNNLIFHDSFLESYLYALVYRIYPSSLDEGRPGILNVRVYKDLSPNAFIFSNGSLFISTGLLSIVNSEDELIGALAHEISHFVLDHSVININKEAQRQKRAEFWAGIATGLASAVDIYSAYKNEYYEPGALTMSTAILAYNIAESINNRMGVKYSQEQEYEADKCAVELMNFIGIDKTALSSVLLKLKDYCKTNGEYIALSGEGSHPAIAERVQHIGIPKKFIDVKYDKMISFVNTYNAILEFNNQHFTASMKFVNRNIIAKVATEEDLVLLAMSTLNLFDNEEKNLEVLSLLEKAKNLNIAPSLNMYKYEAIALIRLNKIQNAIVSLNCYKEKLIEEQNNLLKVINPGEWSIINNYLLTELEWTAKMINKTKML